MEVQAVILSKKLIDAGKTPNGAWNKPQIECLGLRWPLRSGWKKELEGKLILKSDYERFLRLATDKKTTCQPANPKPTKTEPKTESSWHVKNGRITFGKYKGNRLDAVIRTDKQYIKWACENVEGFACNIPIKHQPKHIARPAARKPSGLVQEVIERMESGTSPYVHSTNAPHNAFDPNGFPTQDRIDYHMSQLNPNHRMLEALEDHLDQNFMNKWGGQFDDVDDAPPW